jgi:Predicted permeases
VEILFWIISSGEKNKYLIKKYYGDENKMIQFLWLVPLGFLVGTFGTLIGAGGGFILVPILLLVYPDKSPDTITSMSLAVVLVNALSGSFAYSKMKRIDYKSGIMFAIATIPGSILGSITTSYIPRNIFNGIFGVLLVAASIFLMVRTKVEKNQNISGKANYVTRTIEDTEGNQYTYSFNPVLGVVLSIFVGYLSSFLGIGGGIIHVPALVHLLNFPVHIATATSHFILAVMALSGTSVHIASGVLEPGIVQTIALSIGVLFGAQLGARLSKKLHGVAIIRSLAVALAVVGVRIFIMAF